MPWDLWGSWSETIAEIQDSLQSSTAIPSKIGSQGCLVHGTDGCLQMAQGRRSESRRLKAVATTAQYELIRYPLTCYS